VKSVRAKGAFEPALAEQQSWLFERVTRADELARLDAACNDDARWLREGRLPAALRIDVYRRGYVERLVECLSDDYPAVAYALGSPEFEASCRDFIQAHPPQSSSLNFYGAPFAAFCANRPSPFAACVSQLAQLEWAVVRAIHADAESVLDATALGGIPEAEWVRARLVPSPALEVLRLSYPVHRYYRAFLEGEKPDLPDLEPSVVAVSRRGDDIWRIGIAAPFAVLLSQLVGGVPLASALEALSAADTTGRASGISGEELRRTFSEWVACGFFAAVTFD
jgi:hypothetical protein